MLVNQSASRFALLNIPLQTSKYNPIEHRYSSTRACQGVIPFNSVEINKSLDESKKHTGLPVLATVLDKGYQTGRKAPGGVQATMEIRAR